MNYKYVIEYKFVNDYEVHKLGFDDFVKALQKQGSIVKQYKDKLEYCIFK